MWFDINFNKLVVENTPTFLRKEILLPFLKAFVYPIDAMYNQWYRKRLDDLYKLAHTGQVCYLRKALNDRFDVQQRRIIINNGNRYIRKYIYSKVEQKPTYLGKVFLHSRTDYEDTGVDFIVFVPGQIVNSQKFELEALINFYKEGVKKYKIVSI